MKTFLFITFILLGINTVTAQERPKITSNDEVIIKRKAIGLIDDLTNKYNQLLDADTEDRKIIIDNMILFNNDNISTFVDDQVNIEDDFNTRELSSSESINKKVDIYFKDVCFNYGREDNGNFQNEGKNIILSNIRSSKIMAIDQTSPLFIKVFFDMNYTGIDKRTNLPFKMPCSRVAEIKIEKNKNIWYISISTIRFMKSEEPDYSKNVTIQPEELTLESRKKLLEIDDNALTKITIKSNINAARVKVDGTEVGYLKNNKFDYFIKPGIYKFQLSLDKYEADIIETNIRIDSNVVLQMPMRKIYSNVKFSVEPSDATVLVDDKPVGSGNFVVSIQKGRHELVVDKAGYKPEKTIIDVLNDEMELKYQIFKISKTFEFITSPPDVAITNNKDTLGRTPLTISLPFGQHNLIFYKQNYIPHQQIINVENSGVERMDIVMREKPEVIAAREISKIRGKRITKFIIFGGLAYTGYWGYKRFENEFKSFDPTKNSDEKDRAEIFKWVSGGIGGIFAIASTVNLIKIFTINKSNMVRSKMLEKSALGFTPINSGGVFTFRTTF